VKLLTGLTDLELQRTMNLMRASMGTHCDYCHVIDEEWDFASDEKLPQAAPPFPTPVHETPQLIDAKEIIAKYAAALGDASLLKVPRVLKGERTNSQGTVPFELNDEDPNPAFALVAPSDVGEKALTTGKEKVGEAEVWVVKGDKQRFYFDTKSGLLLRRVQLTPRAVGTIPQQTDYEDYRDAGGVKFPFRVRVSMVDPWTSATRQYTSVDPEASK
jgi:hypothetical protein